MTESPLPRVSIIMPAFNAEAYVADSIASVQAQTMSEWELLVTDDGSTDSTANVVEHLALSDRRIQLFRQSNGKQGKARNLALKHARAPWVAFLDADDLWYPEKLSRQFNVVEAHPEVNLVYTGGISFSGPNLDLIETFGIKDGLIDEDDLYADILRGYSLPILSVLVQRAWIDKVGGFVEDLRLQNAEDYQLWLKMADAGIRVFGINEELFQYRIHEAQSTFNDGLNIKNVVWALSLTTFSRLTISEAKKLMELRLNRYLVHNIDVLDERKVKSLISLYIEPIGRRNLFWKVQMRLLLGKKTFKKWAYENLDLNISKDNFAYFNGLNR